MWRASERKMLHRYKADLQHPFLSSCDSPTDLPTMEGRTRLKSLVYCKNDTDFPLKACSDRVCRQPPVNYSLSFLVLRSLDCSVIGCHWKLASPISPVSLLADAKALSLTTIWSLCNTVEKEENGTALLDGETTREIQGMKAVKLNVPLTWKEAI